MTRGTGSDARAPDQIEDVPLAHQPVPRRAFIIGAAATAFSVACGKGGNRQVAPPQRIDFNTAHVELAKDDTRLAFALFRAEQPLAYDRNAKGTLTLKSPSGERIGPLELRIFPIARSAGGEDAERNGEEPTLVFVARQRFDEEGFWDVVADVTVDGKRIKVPGRVGVPDKSQTVGTGEDAIEVETPTVDDRRGVEPICTRNPNCTMHGMSLDEALKNGRPTVVTFATPALCESRMCGPDVDVVEAVHLRRADEANFIHVEIYKDAAGSKLAPAVLAWKVDKAGEPWVFFVGADGTVRERISGPIGEWEVDEAVGRLSRG